MTDQGTIYLYHIVPTRLKGTALHALNELRTVAPDVYAEQFAKYAGREKVTQIMIPLLNCLWNDVIHLSAVTPAKIRDAMFEAGFKWTPQRWLKIDPMVSGISNKNAVIWKYPRTHDTGDSINDEDIEPFSMLRLSEINVMPEATKNYYRTSRSEEKRPLVYKYVPHILFNGSIEFEAAEQLTV